MHLTLVIVSSLDGKTTRWHQSGIYQWTSLEDQKYFFSLIEKNNLIIMGRKTFEAAKSVIKLSPTKLRIVLTHQPEKYQIISVPGQLEFSSEAPTQLMQRLQKNGYTEALLVGGSQTSSEFIKANLINEIYLTIEPHLFGTGDPLLSEELDSRLELLSMEKLNHQGTLVLKYKVMPAMLPESASQH